MNVLETLADFACGAEATDLAPSVIEILRRHVADSAVAFIAGARTHEAKAILRLDSGSGGDEPVAIAAAIVRHSEIDDIHLSSCTTPSAVAAPTALLLAMAEPKIDHERVASAIMVGTELIVRFGEAINGPAVLYRGIWPTCVAAPLGAAAIAARMWGLDRSRVSHALSLALMMAAGRTGRFRASPSGRWALFMTAVLDGLRAARAAQSGFVGDPGLLDGEWLHEAYALQADISKFTDGLGQRSVYLQLGLKPFCTARQALAPTQALSELLDEGINPHSIERITVRVPRAYAGMISQSADPRARSSGLASVGFQMGLAALRRESLWDVDRSEVMRDASVLAFAQKVKVAPDDKLQVEFPFRWPGSIDVDFAGCSVSCEVMVATGDSDRPLDSTAFDEKAHRILDPLVGREDATKLTSTALDGLSNAHSCQKLIDIFASATPARKLYDARKVR